MQQYSNFMEDESQGYPHTPFDLSLMRMSIKTLTHDYYMAELPIDKSNEFYQYFPNYLEEHDFRGKRINMAPVARIYGTNEFGQKCCCHIHGYFPYFYIKAQEYSDAFTKDKEFLVHFLTLVEGLYQRAYNNPKPIIINAFTEQKLDFYGYHQKTETFLKIIVYDPSYIPKLRELLDSKILGGKIFQCYQAHLNYFMHLFSDHNIYGINELSVIKFTFRKNLAKEIMDLFKKVNTKTAKFMDQGFDLIELSERYPYLFNSQFKISSCYIQIDVNINNILSTFISNHKIEDQYKENSMDSEMEIESGQKTKFIVKITRALEQIWEDEKKRRKKYGIQQEAKGILDYSKNIEARILSGQEKKDPLWINFIKKGVNMDLFNELVRSFQRGQKKKQTNEIEIYRQVSQNYSEVLHTEKEKLIEKVKARWKYYGMRKMNMIQQILRGERQQLPEWADDKMNEEQSAQDEDQKQQEQEDQVEGENLDTKSENLKSKSVNNTLLYRRNYKHAKASLIKESFFYTCEYCKNVLKNCLCKDTQNSTETADTFNLSIEQPDIIYDQSCSTTTKWRYQLSAPTIEQVLQDSIKTAQKPYYSNFKDLFNYHKINQYYEPCLKHAQILQRQLKMLKDYNREPITIKNQLKLPSYFIVDTTIDYDENEEDGTTYQQDICRIKYDIAPPTYDEIVKDCTKSVEHRQIGRRSIQTNISKQDNFVSDLVIFHYDFLFGFQNNCERYYGDPQKDQIVAFCYHVRNFQNYRKAFKGLIAIQKYIKKQSLPIWSYEDIYLVKNQKDLISMVINIIFRIDPDLMVTFDQQKRGIRYLAQRGFAYGINFPQLISRSCDIEELFEFINFREFIVAKEMFLTKDILLRGNIIQNKPKNKKSAQLSFLEQRLKRSLKRKPILRQKYKFDLEVRGRVNISVYRICEAQLRLKSYTIENICKHLFGEQISQFTDKELFRFYSGQLDEKLEVKINNKEKRLEEAIHFVLDYFNKRLDVQAEIIVNLNMVSVLVEKSKIFGCDIVSMMERGSQFKIEAIMCRVTKKLGYLTLSASKRQVGNQSVLDCMPLVLQPPKQFFSEPVLLFDFQSLYPSVMIAYNLCYSTCLGNINNLFDKDKLKRLGVSQKMNIDFSFLEDIFKKFSGDELKTKIEEKIFLSPNKVAFVKKSVKEGVLPRILLQFLISRIMIKKSQGFYSKLKIKKVLKDRQYALKIFMNVMFGYSGASFSGRMPCSQIADSIVQVSKYLLRQSIDYLNEHSKYKGKVLYGDTDSIFFHLPGYSSMQAIEIGKQLAIQITKMFPYPVQMKFQKVYDGLFLVAKKRYYGKSYQSETSGPKYQGKGLECVRRDGISLTENLMRKMLNKLIDDRDLSQLKEMFKQQCSQILNNQKLQSQFCLAKEVKLLKYSDKTCPAHGQAAKRLEKIDPMLVPKYGERMKYFVINGGLMAIKNRSIAVFEYLLNKNMSLDLDYYFKKQVVPPLQRVLSSLADLNEWTASVEYRHKIQFSQSHQLQVNKTCLRCGQDTYFVVCEKCFPHIDEEIRKIQTAGRESIRVCKQCTGYKFIAETNKCVEWNCHQLWRRRAIQKANRNTLPELFKLRQALLQLKY